MTQLFKLNEYQEIKTRIFTSCYSFSPTYLVAYFTDKMVYTIPMLAASSFIAASISSRDTKLKVDDDAEGSDGSDS